MTLPIRPLRLAEPPNRRFDPHEKLTRAELYMELREEWEANLAVVNGVLSHSFFPGMAEAAAILRNAIRTLNATYKIPDLLGCSEDFIVAEVDSAKTTRQTNEGVV